jgi:hypothetical protein
MSKSALIIDDYFIGLQVAYEDSLGLTEDQVEGFPDIQSAKRYLAALAPSDFPEILIFDCVGAGGLFAADKFEGVYNAIALAKIYREHGVKPRHVLFKSVDPIIARDNRNEFSSHLSDLACGTVVPNIGGDTTFAINWNGYTPPVLPDLVRDFTVAYQYTKIDTFYDTLRGKLRPLLAQWNNLNDVVVEDDDIPVLPFQAGFGSACRGPVVFDLADVETVAAGPKPVLVTHALPQNIMDFADRLSAIVLTGDFDLPGHLRILLEPYDVALMVGGDCSELEKGQIVTLSPQARKLWTADFDIVTPDEAMPRLKNAVADIKFEADRELARGSAALPSFTVNISGRGDLRQADGLPIGLLRAEHFISPYADPSKWAAIKEILIGRGLELRAVFDRVSGKSAELPFIARRREEYAELLRAPSLLSSYHMSLEAGDVFRLYDIPAEEFLNGADLTRFEEVFGKSIRGVGLARRVPDLYVTQIKALEKLYIQSKKIPDVLIPAVKTADDIRFVKGLFDEHYPKPKSVMFGAMIETPEACANIEDIAREAGFISLGTNDLTAAVLGTSRQDRKFQENLVGNLPDPVLDLIGETVMRARRVNPETHVSLCGEAAANIKTLEALKVRGIWIDEFSVAPTYRNTELLPLVYKDYVIQNFCGPLLPGENDEMHSLLKRRMDENNSRYGVRREPVPVLEEAVKSGLFTDYVMGT